MIELKAQNLGKKFYRQWVFRKVNLSLHSGDSLLLTGPNGSGKSTLMRILAGQLSPTEGDLSLTWQGKVIPYDRYYRHISWAGPYMDLYNDLTLAEAVKLHFRFRSPLLPGVKAIIRQLRLEKHQNKFLKHYSSGMLHRVKVGLSIYSKSEILLLDEATTNLDRTNTEFIFEQLETFKGDRILVYASNADDEFSRFENRMDLGDRMGNR